LPQEEYETLESESEKDSKKLSRREFLKYGVGVAAVAAGATALIGRLPIPTGTTSTSQTRPTGPTSSTPLVVMVKGDELTVMNETGEVVVKDASLASAIASKME
jgi:secreted PhoX family phosphatase